ncbi:MAG: hypothetical protein EA352_01030 [Gemmatimonadales bacterium]|nr:MAG: hypothetical protein EA352_01030 [Gemmatimonadales bacterium]
MTWDPDPVVGQFSGWTQSQFDAAISIIEPGGDFSFEDRLARNNPEALGRYLEKRKTFREQVTERSEVLLAPCPLGGNDDQAAISADCDDGGGGGFFWVMGFVFAEFAPGDNLGGPDQVEATSQSDSPVQGIHTHIAQPQVWYFDGQENSLDFQYSPVEQSHGTLFGQGFYSFEAGLAVNCPEAVGQSEETWFEIRFPTEFQMEAMNIVYMDNDQDSAACPTIPPLPG